MHPEWVPQHVVILYLLLGHLFKVHIPVWFVPGVFASLKPPRLPSGDAFSVFFAIRMVRARLAKVCVRINKVFFCRNMQCNGIMSYVETSH